MHKFFYSITICYVTLQSLKCFEHQHAHLQEDKLYYHSIWYHHSLYSTVQYSLPDESRLQSTLIRHTVQPFTESDDTRCCDNTICPPEDGHVDARNMSRIVM